MKTLNLIYFGILAVLLTSCSGEGNNNSNKNEKINTTIKRDSVELTNLIRQSYKWHMEKTIDDFPFKQQDSIFIGIDWDEYQRNIKVLSKTNFFSRDFFLKHKNIALTLDSSIRKADISWRNINDGIPIWASEVDDWCNCQDYPDNYWKTLTIDSLIIKDGFAEFKWTWDMKYHGDYKVTAKKEDGKWWINSLQGYNNYYSVDHYDKIMNE
jgi:hypothetical protein